MQLPTGWMVRILLTFLFIITWRMALGSAQPSTQWQPEVLPLVYQPG
jgi:hypothetical protein